LAGHPQFATDAKTPARFHIRFTAKPKEIHIKLMALYQSIQKN
jgi:hypothetical protein